MRKGTKYLAAVAAIALGSASPFMVAAQTMQKSPARLADIMSAVQFRHSKLWAAGQQKNWELAGYELELVKSSLSEAIALYVDIPVENITMIDPPIKSIESAIAARNSAAFGKAFGGTDYRMQFLSSIGRPRLHRHDGPHGVAFRQSVVCAAPGAGQGRHAPVNGLAGRFVIAKGKFRSASR